MKLLAFLTGSGGGSAPIEVLNYSLLPPVGTAPGTTYIVLESQGTSWLPGSLGGTYYPEGYYYDATTKYVYSKTPYQATQSEVDAGTNDDKFITSKTFNDSTQLASKVPETRTVNGKQLNANITLTSSDVGAPSGSGTSTGTNTGDETQSSILAKLGWHSIQDLTPSSVVTGTTTETIVKSIPLWTLTNDSILRVFNLKLTKIAVAACTVKLYINNVDNNLSGAIQIATTGNTWTNTGRIVDALRTFNIVGGNIEGVSSTANVLTDVGQFSGVMSSQSLPSGQLYLIITVQNGAVGEETTFRSVCLKNL